MFGHVTPFPHKAVMSVDTDSSDMPLPSLW
jgi:hypothetical protein